MPCSPYAVNAQMQFGGNIGCMFSNPVSAYQNAYQTYINNANNFYNTITSGYKGLANTLNTTQQGITQGYNQLSQDVLGTIKGICQSQMQAVQCSFTKANAATQQQLINSGLGNSTVLQSAQRGNQMQEALAQTAVKNQFAQLYAGYQSNLGLAGLNYQNQAAQQQTALGQGELENLLRYVNVMPPCANAYSQQYWANLARMQAAPMPGNSGPPQQVSGPPIPQRFTCAPGAGACGYGGYGGGGQLISSYGFRKCTVCNCNVGFTRSSCGYYATPTPQCQQMPSAQC